MRYARKVSEAVVVAMAIVCFAVACSSGSNGEATFERSDAASVGRRGGALPVAVALAPTPVRALRACRRLPIVRRQCPRRLPQAGRGTGLGIQLWVCRRGDRDCPTWDAFNFQWGAESPRRPERNRPGGNSGVVHLVIYGGDLGGPRGFQTKHADSAFPFDWPSQIRSLRDRLMNEQRPKALLLLRTIWGGRDGELVLAPRYELGGLMGDHLIFRWRAGQEEYAVGLHAWEPLTEAAASLRSVLLSAGRKS
jgi:hypothetical protein